jgi:hypothetical protein
MPGMLWCSATQYRLNPHCSTCRARSTLRRSASWVDSPIGTGQRSSAREVWAKSTVAVDPPGMSGSATSGCRHTDNRIVSSSDPAPYVPPAGEAYFPLASNAHALVAGGHIGSVRSRMKVSSLLYNRVLLESGQMVIQAGPRGSSAFRHGSRADAPASWQTLTARSRAQAVPFTLSMARETTPGVPAPARTTRSSTRKPRSAGFRPSSRSSASFRRSATGSSSDVRATCPRRSRSSGTAGSAAMTAMQLSTGSCQRTTSGPAWSSTSARILPPERRAAGTYRRDAGPPGRQPAADLECSAAIAPPPHRVAGSSPGT